MHTDLVSDISKSLEIRLPETLSMEELKKTLVTHINHLINNDFEKLVFYLYRIDVNESKMKQLIDRQEGENAAGLIADLIIERQSGKIKSRQQSDSYRTRQQDSDIDENEKW